MKREVLTVRAWEPRAETQAQPAAAEDSLSRAHAPLTRCLQNLEPLPPGRPSSSSPPSKTLPPPPGEGGPEAKVSGGPFLGSGGGQVCSYCPTPRSEAMRCRLPAPQLPQQRAVHHIPFCGCSPPPRADFQGAAEGQTSALSAKDTQILGQASRDLPAGTLFLFIRKQGLCFWVSREECAVLVTTTDRVTRADNVPFLRGGSLSEGW